MTRFEFLFLVGIVIWFSTGLGIDPERSGSFLLAIAAFVLFWRGIRDYQRNAVHSRISCEKDEKNSHITNTLKKRHLMFGELLLRGLVAILFSLKVVGIPTKWNILLWSLIVIIYLVFQIIQRKTA